MEEVQRREFAIGNCLGRGGFGEVYRATMRSSGGLDSTVALKVLRDGLDPSSQAVQRLRDEGRLLARLDYPVILRVHDLVVLNGRVGLVTEYVEGEDLSGCLHADPPITRRALVEVIGHIAGALHAAWSAPSPNGGTLELVHRDIKPSNIRISKHGHVKLLDFGIARSDALSREARTQTDLVVGSPYYLAPERFLDPAVRPEADVFALGLSLFEGLTQQRFYADATVLMMSAQALAKERFEEWREQRLSVLPADLEPALRSLLLDLLQYEPEKRPDAAALMLLCENLAEELGGDSLIRWSRARDWPDPSEEAGPLEGMTISEGTRVRTMPSALETVVPRSNSQEPLRPPEGATTSSTARNTAMAAGLFAALGVIAVVGVVATAMVLAFWPMAGTEPELADAVDVPSVGDAAVLEAEPGADSEDGAQSAEDEGSGSESTLPPPRESVGSAPAPREEVEVSPPAPEPAKTTVISVPAPRVEEAPPSEPKTQVVVATGQVDVEGGVRVELQGALGTVSVPGVVPVGDYTITAFYVERQPRSAGTIHVSEGGRSTIVCSSRMMRCSIR